MGFFCPLTAAAGADISGPMSLRSSVSPDGSFVYGIHRPVFRVANRRVGGAPSFLGLREDGTLVDNRDNFPEADLTVDRSDWVYEIANPFPFRGSTYISKGFADAVAQDPETIALSPPPELSFTDSLRRAGFSGPTLERLLQALPRPLLLALATTSTDPEDLRRIAEISAGFLHDDSGRPTGLAYRKNSDGVDHAAVPHHDLFKAVANNAALPDDYKRVMVLRPGAQGPSEIVGEWPGSEKGGPVCEYFRRNSYIPWGHYAANMADDAVRYRLEDLGRDDMTGLRHLYYQRTFLRLADDLGLTPPSGKGLLEEEALEALRRRILERLDADGCGLPFSATLWGWNFGFDRSPTGYRLHGSHQQIHQQYALVPACLQGEGEGVPLPAFACGDLVADFADAYQRRHGEPFFPCYLRAVRENRRMAHTGGGEDSLVVYEDDKILVFVPKAQTSPWELQMMPLAPVGNVLEADGDTRAALDRGMLVAVRVLAALGARMITSIELSKRFDRRGTDQRLVYCFLPRLPESPGAFSEAQLRWINRHYPEDFASACRSRLPGVIRTIDNETP
jgi:hypothetical protein